MLRIISRNEKTQDVLLKGGKLACTCGDAVFTGIPCRHMLSLSSKQEGIGYENLPFNPVWKKVIILRSMKTKNQKELKRKKKKKKLKKTREWKSRI